MQTGNHNVYNKVMSWWENTILCILLIERAQEMLATRKNAQPQVR
jgi:hypothetical protein